MKKYGHKITSYQILLLSRELEIGNFNHVMFIYIICFIIGPEKPYWGSSQLRHLYYLFIYFSWKYIYYNLEKFIRNHRVLRMLFSFIDHFNLKISALYKT